eukprot:scaffold29024_cov51-Phaeocystis_antarctica.AAC.2
MPQSRLPPKLRARVSGGGGCQPGLAREWALRCGGALDRGDGAAPEPLAQLGDALGGVPDVPTDVATDADTAELVGTQPASKGEGGGTGANGAWHKSGRYSAAAHSSEVTALPLSPSHNSVPWPFEPRPQSWFWPNLRARVRVGVVASGAWHESGRYGAAAHPNELGDALGGVGAAAIVVSAAELVAAQAASKGEGRSQRATSMQTNSALYAMRMAPSTPETAHRGRGRQHDAEQPRSDDVNAG